MYKGGRGRWLEYVIIGVGGRVVPSYQVNTGGWVNVP